MFGSTNPFGQSSTSSPFGQQQQSSGGGGGSPFGQSTNPFAPKPFGSPTTPFGAHTSSSIFGGSSTGVFGQPSTPLFGASSTPAFGASSTSAFGASSSSTPAFGSGSSLFGQKPAFGSFGSSPAQSSSPFGSGFQQSQPAFGTTAFGASSTPAFGASSTPAFGASTTPAFGASSTPAFGSTSTSLFGNTTGAFGASTTPAFGATNSPLFGASSTPAFGASSTPAFGASSTPAFGAASTPAFGAASTPSFSFGSTPAFGQTGSTFGSTPFGTSPSPFGAQSSAFGAQTTTPTFGSSPSFGQQTAFGAQGGGSRITPFTPTPEEGVSSTAGQIAKLESISAMPAYKDKSHEELRWEDYQRGDKGGPNPNPVSAFGGQTAPTQPSPFGTTGTFGQAPATNPFSSSTTSNNPFAPKTSTPTFGSTGFGSTTGTPSLFGSASSSPFNASTSFNATATTPSIFGTPSSAAAPSFSSSPSLFGGTSTPAFGGSSTFNSGAATGSNPFGATFGGGTQSSGLFSSTPSFGHTPSPFGQPSAASGFQQTTSVFGSSILNTPSTGFGGNMFSNTASSPLFPSAAAPSGFGQTNAALSTPFQPAAPAQSSGAFSFGNFGQTQSAGSGGFGFGSTFGQNTFNQPAANQGGVAVQPIAVTNPFGALPAMPTMSIGRVGSTPSVQYGISSMPVAEKPSAGITRTSSMLVPRHLSQRRIKLPPRRYPSRTDGPRVPYFADEDEVPSTPKADAFLIPRENPRSLILRPIEQWPPHTAPEVEFLSPEDGPTDEPNGRQEEDAFDHSHEHTDRTGKGGGAATRVYNDIEANGGASASKNTSSNGATSASLPTLIQGDYYTVPRISELEKREREDPGYCRRVKDFVIGREGYGSIMFSGETDITGLDLDSIVEFGNREVVVYRDESNKPPVGQGLNKAAEVTLLNVKWVNKKTGQQYLEPDRVRKYTEMLKAKSAQQGAHFISYNPVQGEWKFKVDHF